MKRLDRLCFLIHVENQAQPQIVGQITIARFVNPAGLFSVGRTQFEETAASGADHGVWRSRISTSWATVATKIPS